MRTELGKYEGQRVEVTAKYKKMATVKNGFLKTMLFVNVMVDGKEVTDHCWIRVRKNDQLYKNKIKDHRGEYVRFTALVSTYNKLDNNGNQSYDYHLVKIDDIEILGK